MQSMWIPTRLRFRIDGCLVAGKVSSASFPSVKEAQRFVEKHAADQAIEVYDSESNLVVWRNTPEKLDGYPLTWEEKLPPRETSYSAIRTHPKHIRQRLAVPTGNSRYDRQASDRFGHLVNAIDFEQPPKWRGKRS